MDSTLQYKLEERVAHRPLNIQPLICSLLFLAIFAGCQGGRYYMSNRLQELGIFSALLLMSLGAWRAVFQLNLDNLKDWVLKPVCLIFGIMLISSMAFYVNYGGNPLYSFFSAREFMLAFVGPGVYLLCRTGLPVRVVETTVRFALVALMLNYLFFYFTLDLKSLFFSTDHTLSNLVTYDDWRGFRLKPPLFAIMVGLMAAFIGVGQARTFMSWAISLSVMGIAIYIWSIVMFRSTLATMAMAMLLYPALFASKNRIPLVVVMSPLLILSIPVGFDMMLDVFLGSDGGGLRKQSFELAFQQIPGHLIFGAGEDNAYGATYQDIVGPYFFPDDIGFIGTLYKYGVVGAFLYLYMHIKIWSRLWAANIQFKKIYGRLNPQLWAIFMWLTAMAFNLVLNPGLAYAQGITLASIGFALASLHLNENGYAASITTSSRVASQLET
ncbi:hypothetical protein EYC98_06805 [Halieaceae bacterium IMCC14734]|uniref:O-antigen ligase domain-containing protein n=1 Tax=Candidatus Litorirhabdus singularis TaxID=2518993 RepID=A0ABT3TE81_9GAMM|nr:hypothetical protein [Candidatus Litorirhabdus singularis]MCX2980583.1 hypothetical protein [Candidatus Litorirhabdus singularis]